MHKTVRISGLLVGVAILAFVVTATAWSRRDIPTETGMQEGRLLPSWGALPGSHNRPLLAVAVYHHRGNVERFFSRSRTSTTHTRHHDHSRNNPCPGRIKSLRTPDRHYRTISRF